MIKQLWWWWWWWGGGGGGGGGGGRGRGGSQFGLNIASSHCLSMALAGFGKCSVFLLAPVQRFFPLTKSVYCMPGPAELLALGNLSSMLLTLPSGHSSSTWCGVDQWHQVSWLPSGHSTGPSGVLGRCPTLCYGPPVHVDISWHLATGILQEEIGTPSNFR